MKIVVCSIPKSGTYLVGQIFKEFGFVNSGLHFDVHVVSDYSDADIPSARSNPEQYLVRESLSESITRLQEGQYALSHLPPTAIYILRHCEVIFVYRNLRDVMISFCRWIADTGRWNQSNSEPWRELPDSPDKLLGFMRTHGVRVFQRIKAAVRWREMIGVPSVSFEELMGDYGVERTLVALRLLADSAGIHRDDAELCRILDKALATETMTRSNSRSSYQDFWNNEVETEFWSSGLGDLNAILGYEERKPQSKSNVLYRGLEIAWKISKRLK